VRREDIGGTWVGALAASPKHIPTVGEIGQCRALMSTDLQKLQVLQFSSCCEFPRDLSCKSWLQKQEAGMAIYGYARVSTRDQDLAAQCAELMAAGCAKVFQEKVSGAKTDRAELAKVLRRLEAGDVLVVTRLDRLARSTRDLLNVIAAVTERGAGFRSLKDAWADTTSPHGRLMLTVLGGLAEFERELIRARTGEGRRRAKDRGVKFGRPRKLTPHQRQEAIQRLTAGETQADVARTYNVDPTTIGRLSGDRPFRAGGREAGHEVTSEQLASNRACASWP
jgi:DNA invertase Pin-like site-specific DNA recombinase